MDDSSRQIELVRALKSGMGLQRLANEVYNILGNPVFLHNMEYESVAVTENIVTDDPLWNEATKNGSFSRESIEFFLEECFIDIVAKTKSVTLLTSDKLKYERLYGRIFNCYNNTVLDLIVLACVKPFEQQDALVFEAVCEKFSQEICESEFYKNYGIQYHDKLICNLLNAGVDDKLIHSDHIANLYEGMKANLYVAVADISQCSAVKYNPDEVRDLLKEMQPEFKYAVYSNYVVIIAGTDKASLNIKRDFHKLIRYFNDNNIRVGVSKRFDNLFNLREHFDEAVGTLKSNRKKTDKPS